jgi:hypothetical protein
MSQQEISELLNRPAFARGSKKELRQDIDVEILNVLDAVSLARDVTRAELVNEILEKYAQQRLRELTLLQRLTRGNPQAEERVGSLTV